jgi:nucleotide-binding universal stress UspA family protein
MKRFKNILLVHERGTRGRKARDWTADLAARNKASIKLVEVSEPLPALNTQYKTEKGEIDLQALVAKEIDAALAVVAKSMARKGTRIKTRVLFGSPFLSIIREVVSGGHDLVVLTAEGDGGLKNHLFGSTSRHLLRKCPCPVWVVRPARRRKRFRVLAAINPSDVNPSSRELDRTILEMSSSLARMSDGELDVVSVWQPAPQSLRIHRKERDQWNSDLLAKAEKDLSSALEGHKLMGLKPRLHLPSGSAGLCIAEVAADRRSDVVVMGTLSRSGLRGLLMGNTCETVLGYIDTSVLAVKPPGFECPIDI